MLKKVSNIGYSSNMPPVPVGWSSFFAAEVGAAAALTGLLFVALSINLSKILAIEHLPSRAAETTLVLSGVLAIATCGLVPGQSLRCFGFEVVLVAFVVWASTLRTQLNARKDVVARKWLFGRIASTQLACLPFLVAGVMLVLGRDAGLYWIVAGVLASFYAGILNAWVLLVEILR